MAASTPFLFDRSFDGGTSVRTKRQGPDPRSLPKFSEIDTQKIREEEFARGRDAGLREATASIEHRTAELQQALLIRFDEMERAMNDVRADMIANAMAVAAAVARKLLPEYCANEGANEIEALFHRMFEHFPHQAHIRVVVPADLADALRERLQPNTAGGPEGSGVTVVVDKRLKGSDCRIEHGDCSIVRSAQALWAEIESILPSVLSAASDPTVISASEADPSRYSSPNSSPHTSSSSGGHHHG